MQIFTNHKKGENQFMKKHIKWTAALSTAAVITALTPSFTAPAMAQTVGWVQENGIWMFYDEDGYSVTDTWKKHDGQWYYLDEDGELSFNRQIEEYYVDAEGKRVANQWVKVLNEDNWDDDSPEYYWYYYGSDGKATTSRFRTISDKTYYFDGDGRMITGLAEIEGDTYYFGTSDDGVMKKGWVELESENYDEEPSWYYFNSNGKMVQNEIDKRINGNYYTFKDGKMQTGWFKMPEEASAANTDATNSTETAADDAVNAATDAAGSTETAAANTADAAADAAGSAETAAADTADAAADADTAKTETADDHTADANTVSVQSPAAGYQYYDSDGKRASGWRTIQGIPGVSQEDELYKFYFKNGQPYFAQEGIQIFFINSGRYGFNNKGEMQTGLQTVTLEDGSTATYYFGTDGVMKTGKQTIFSDEEGINQTWFFHTDGDKRGQGYTGIRDNAIYENGLRKQADPSFRYAPVSFDGKSYLVSTAGSIQKATNSSKSAVRPELGDGFRDFKDLSEFVWTVDVNGVIQ